RALRKRYGIGAYLVIILLPNPSLRADIERREHLRQGPLQLGRRVIRDQSPPRRTSERPVVQRRLVGQFAIGDFRDNLAVLPDAQLAVIRDDADFNRFQAPLPEYAENFFLAA